MISEYINHPTFTGLKRTLDEYGEDADYITNLEAIFGLSYQFVSERYQVVANVLRKPENQGNQVIWNRAMSLFMHSALNPDRLGQHIADAQKKSRGENSIVDTFLEDSIHDLYEEAGGYDGIGVKDELLYKLLVTANALMDAAAQNLPFAEAFSETFPLIDDEVDLENLELFLSGINKSAPHWPTLHLEKQKFKTALHIVRLEVNPHTQVRRTLSELDQLRRNESAKKDNYFPDHNYHGDIVGLSHLLSRSMIMKGAGLRKNGLFHAFFNPSLNYHTSKAPGTEEVYKLETDQGLYVRFIDPNDFLQLRYYFDANIHTYPVSDSEAVSVSFFNINESPIHMLRFIENAVLPEVGAIVIPAEMFWKV